MKTRLVSSFYVAAPGAISILIFILGGTLCSCSPCDCVQLKEDLVARELDVRALRARQEELEREIAALRSKRVPQWLSSLPMANVEKLGQIFMSSKFSHILMSRTVAKTFNVDISNRDEPSHLADFAPFLLTVPVSRPELFGSKLARSTVNQLTQRLKDWGVVAMRSMLPRQTCDELSQEILEGIKRPTYKFGKIQHNAKRFDYPLIFDKKTAGFFERVIRIVGPVLVTQLGLNATLVEFSSITSFPGSYAQDLHPDAGMDTIKDVGTARVITTFVSLSDVDEDMAALDVMPASHTHYHFLHRDEKSMLDSVPLVRMAIPKGSIIVMDSRTYHRGSNNTSTKKRPVFYFSFMGEKGPPPFGPTYSMRRMYNGAITLYNALMRQTLSRARIAEKNRTEEMIRQDAKWRLPRKKKRKDTKIEL